MTDRRRRPAWRDYARSPDEARAFRSTIRAFLICPACGSSPHRLVDSMRSKSSVTLRCQGCRIRFNIRRVDLAESARRKADIETDPERAAILRRVAHLFAPLPGAAHPDPLPIGAEA